MMSPRSSYDNAFAVDNVYGHALALLVRNRSAHTRTGDVVHLDVGCGFGRIAEPLVAATGRSYVGVDGAEEGLASLRQRRFEAHKVWLEGEKETFDSLMRVIGRRSVASITMLDTLEHLTTGDAVLSALQRIAMQHNSCVVVSVPNVAHRDVGMRLAFGRWNYTDTGLLDHTHTRFYTASTLDAVLARAGLHPVDANDVIQVVSDQHFPEDHPALTRGSLLARLVQQLRDESDEFGTVNQLVRACVPGPAMKTDTFVGERNPARPFLSVVTRTQGLRPQGLQEVFTSLAGQTCTDFEVVVVGHQLDVDRQIAVERIIEDNPEWLRTITRLIRVYAGNRTRPLNEGFAASNGHYIAILDDDDVPMAHWVETFKDLAAVHPGRVLRAVAARQNVRNVRVQQADGIRAVGPLERIYASTFDYVSHLRENSSPNLAIAFPRGVFHELNLRFDENLTTTEDWDYLLRVASVTGVACSPTITGIYRWWVTDDSSRTHHAQREWDTNYQRIVDKMDNTILVLPEGSASQLRKMLAEREQLESEIHRLQATIGDLRATIDLMANSALWRCTAPLRGVARSIRSRARNGRS